MRIPDDFDTAAAKVAGQLSTDPVDVAAREVVNGQRTQVKASLYNALLQNPDMAARAQQLGRQAGIPADVVSRNMPEVERNVRLNDFDRVLENSPTVAQWLTDQNNAAIGHDDVDNMGAVESTLRVFKRAGGAAVSGLQRASAGVVGIGQAGFELMAPLADPLVGTILPGNPLRGTAQGLSRIRQGIDAQAKANMPKSEGIVESGIYSGIASLSTNLATLPLAFLPGGQGAALTGMVAPVAGGSYGQARDKNIAPIQALSFGVSQAAIEYATEKLPLAKLVGDLKVGAPLYKVIANQVVREVPGEQLATVLQDLNEWAVLNPDKPFSSYLEERPSAAAQTLIATMVGVGGQVSVVKGLQAAVERIQSGPTSVEQGGADAASSGVVQSIMEGALQMRLKNAQVEMAGRDAQALTQLTELVQASKLAQRDPAAFEAFVAQVVADGPVQDVYVNAQTFAQAAQEAGVQEQQLPENIREQLAEAIAIGGDIRIPIQEFASQIAPTQYAQGLIQHLKVDPMGMSSAEAQVFMQTQVEEMQTEMAKSLAERDADVQFKTSIDQVRNSFTEQLNTANRFTPEVNASYANMLANFYAVTAAKVGMTPEALVQRYPLRIQAEGVQGAAQQFDQSAKIVTDTPEFKNWFGKSKVTGAEGKPLVVYHGTTGDFDSFSAKFQGTTTGATSSKSGFFFTSSPRTAKSYADHSALAAPVYKLIEEADKAGDKGDWDTYEAKQSEAEALEQSLADPANRGRGQNLVPVYLQMNNPMVFDAKGENPEGIGGIDKLIQKAKRAGHDGLIIQNFDDSAGLSNDISDHYVVFKPEQIKSATGNSGAFDPANPNILKQGTGNRGEIAFGQDITQVPSIITLLKGADLSTFLHESGHFFLEVQFDLASRIGAEAQTFGSESNTTGEQTLLTDTQAMLDWFGVRTLDEWYGLPMEQKRSYHEQFARGFEAYLFEGKAPSIELQGMFQRFRAWLLRVYKDLKALNVELTDEVRGVMDRMLATTEQIELAEKGRSMLPLFAAPEQAGMTTDEFAAYQELGTQASQDAIEDLQARTLRDMQWMRNARGREIKKLQKESAARRAEVMMEARREIMSQPTYRAWQFLTGKLDQNDKAMMAPEPERKSVQGPVDPTVDSLFVAIAKLGGLDRRAVESLWGFDPKERSPMPLFGKYLLRREDGLSPDAMGEALAEYGYLPKDENGKFDQRDLEDAFDAEYRGEPVYAYAKDYTEAMGEKRAGEDADIENMGAGRFDSFALKELNLPQEIADIIVELKMTAKDGIDPDLVAESFGFTSGDELVRTLAIAEAPKVAIEALTDQKMLERFGDLATPEAIERAADAAIHNDTRARFVSTELNALQKAIGKPKVLASAAKEYARAMIDRLTVRNVKPAQYAAAEVRAAKAAEKAMKAGDTAQAAVEKRNQLINTYATKSAHDALTEVEKALRYLGKFNGEGTRKAIDVDYLDQIDSILERFDLRVGQSLKSVDKRKALAKWIDEQEDLGIEVELPEKIMAEAFRQSYKDLTVEEMRGLVDSIKQIEHLGRLKEKLLTAADNRRFADVVGSMVASIEENAGDKKANNRTRDTMGSRALALFKGFVASHRKTASLARELDGFKDAGPMWTYLIRSMNAAGDREASMRAEATATLTKMLKPVLSGARMGGKGQFFPTIAESLNRGEQLVMALNMGNAGNIQRLLDGRGWTLEQVVPVMQNLSASDWQFVQSVWDFFESYRPQIAAKERRVMGKEPNWVEPQQVVVKTVDGQELTLRGGYFPIVYDARESGRAEQQADAESARQQMKGAFVAATTRRSFTKTRAESVSGRPLVLTWDALFRGVNDVIHDLAWHEWVIDANRIVKNEQVDKAIRSTYGADVVQQFKASIRDIAAGDAPNADALSKVLTPLRTGAAVAGLGLNLMNAMLQPLGLTQSMVRVGPKWVAQGIAAWAKSPIELVRTVNDKSEFMRNRARTQQRELNEIQSVVQGKSEARAKIDALMFMPMQSLQLIADMPTWWGAYQKALAEAPVDVDAEVAEDRAIKLADQAVLDAQSGGQVKDLALIQRGGPMQKLFTVFYGYFSAAYNLGAERTKATNFRSPLEVMHLAWDFLLLYSVPAVLASLMKSALQPGGGDEDEEELARRLIGEQISYMMGLMVGLREITGAVQYATGTRQFDMAYGGPAGLRFFQELDKLGKQIGQGELDRALARSVVNVGGVMLHLPSGQINRTVDGVLAISEGKTDNPAAILFGVEK
jgi:hypothetical protein